MPIVNDWGMTTKAEVEAALADNAAGPQSISVDGQTATNHDISKQIEAIKYLGNQEAVRSTNRGIRFNKITPGGAV